MESLEEQFLTAKLRECGGTLFWFCARNDREQIAMFRRAAQAAGRQGRDGRAVSMAYSAEKLAQWYDTNALFVMPAMRNYLEEYLDACPAGARHLLVCSRRNNGPSPINSAFMDFWWGRGVEVWEIGAPWWLLDVEASGLNREKDSITVLRLARLDGLETVEEQTIFVQPEGSLTSWAKRLTGISDRDLERAIPPEDALVQLETARGRFLLLDRGFTRPFLENAYDKHGQTFSHCCLTLDSLLEQLGIPAKQNTKELLEALPAPPASWPDAPPENDELAKLYRLTRALFYRLEGTR